MLLRGEGDFEGALAAATRSVQARHELGVGSVKGGLVEQLEAAMVLDGAKAEELLSDLERLRPGETTPYLMAQAARFRAKLSAGEDDRGFRTALAAFRVLAMPFWEAVTLLEQSEWLFARAEDAAALPRMVEAQEIFERLHAQPWLERLSRLTSPESVSA